MMDEIEVKNMLRTFKENLDNAPDSQAAIVWAGGVSALQLVLEGDGVISTFEEIMELKGNKDKTLRSKEIPVSEIRPWHHFWHERYHRCVVVSVETTEKNHVSIRFRQINTNETREAVWPQDSVFIKVWNIKQSNNIRYGKTRYRR